MVSPNAGVRPRHPVSLWPWFAVGLAIALVWFTYVCSVGTAYRVRGDAIAYLRVVTHAGSIGDVLGYAGDRSLGFPLFLYAIRVAFEIVTPVSPESLGAFVNTMAVALLAIHVVASLVFFRAMSAIAGSSLGVSLHPAALALLVGFPALIAYTTVPLTDTFAADLLMMGAALYARPAEGYGSTQLVRQICAGTTLGAVVLLRPSALVVTSVYVVAGVAQALWDDRRRVPMLAVSATLWATLVGWQTLNCTRAYGGPCLLEPAATRKGMSESIAWGTTSARHYWSRYSNEVEGRVTVPDGLLGRLLGEQCHARTLTGRDGLLGCIASRPIVYPMLVLKKSLGLFDAYHLQPYAVDVTPYWARWLNRLFGALAFAGFVAAAGWLLVLLVSAPAGPLALVLIAPVAHVAWHALFHVEGRYGLAAVPFSLAMLVATVQYVCRWSAASRAAAIVALMGAAAGFLAQTSSWDHADWVLQRIEREAAQAGQ